MPDTPTVAELLRQTAAVLAAAERGFEVLAELVGDTEEIPQQGDARGDLLILATWLDEHPETDAQMMAVIGARL